jgi:hypothetical protein
MATAWGCDLISTMRLARQLLAWVLACGQCVSSAASDNDAPAPDPNRERIATALSDMKQRHEIVPFGIEIKGGWHVAPYVVMGVEPLGSAVPAWWRGIRHAEWHSLAAWFTVYMDSPGTPTVNTGVEIGGIEVWVFTESTRQWTLLRAGAKPSWQGAFNPAADRSLQRSGGKFSPQGTFVAIPTMSYMVHGGIAQTAVPWTDRPDIRALLVSVKHRLAVIDTSKPDDRDLAQFGLLAGADYYPWVGAQVADLGASYNPGAASGRFLRVTKDWRYSTMLIQCKRCTADELSGTPPPQFKY